MMRINIGAGRNPLEGYTNIDRATKGEAYPLSQDGVVFDSGIADEIRASHILEHFSHRLTLTVLKEWVRVLKPGGLLKIAVPDFDYAVTQMGKHEHAPLWIMGGHVDGNDIHGAIFTREKLFSLLSECGIEAIDSWNSEATDCASLPVSLNLCGFKSENVIDALKPEVKKRRKVSAIMSCPRVGFTHTHGCAQNALARFGVNLHYYMGAFWEQGIQNLIQKMIDEGNDDVITLDYDSVFSVEQFERMYAQWLESPEIDAMSCLQPQRGSGRAMLTPIGCDEGPTETKVIHCQTGMKARTAHFGLTFLRLDKVKKLAKPWFWSQPDKDGNWKKEGCVDADIYFWRKWEAAGNNLHILTDVLLGHIEIVIGQVVSGGSAYRHVSDWSEDPYKGLDAVVLKKAITNPAMTYDARSVYHPELESYPDDKYPCSFLQRGSYCLGEPSTDVSGSEFRNVD